MADKTMLIFLAMYVSECWYMDFVRYSRSKFGIARRYAIHARARAAVVHDRVLCGDRSLVEREGRHD